MRPVKGSLHADITNVGVEKATEIARDREKWNKLWPSRRCYLNGYAAERNSRTILIGHEKEILIIVDRVIALVSCTCTNLVEISVCIYVRLSHIFSAINVILESRRSFMKGHIGLMYCQREKAS